MFQPGGDFTQTTGLFWSLVTNNRKEQFGDGSAAVARTGKRNYVGDFGSNGNSQSETCKFISWRFTFQKHMKRRQWLILKWWEGTFQAYGTTSDHGFWISIRNSSKFPTAQGTTCIRWHFGHQATSSTTPLAIGESFQKILLHTGPSLKRGVLHRLSLAHQAEALRPCFQAFKSMAG